MLRSLLLTLVGCVVVGGLGCSPGSPGAMPSTSNDAAPVASIGSNSTPTTTSNATGSTGSDSSGDKSVHVRGYTKKDGTVVQPHTRRPPGSKK